MDDSSGADALVGPGACCYHLKARARPMMRTTLVYKVAFAIGLGAFALSLAGGVGYAVTRRHGVPGLPPAALADYHAYLGRGELRRAARQHQLAGRIDPATYPNAPELADAMRRAGDAEGEIEQYRQARERWPLNPATHRALGVVYCRYGRLDQGIACLREALRLDPGQAKTYLALGDARLEQGRFADAVQSYSEAIRLAPAAAAAHNSLGIAHARSGDHARAAAAFAEAARLDPDPQYAANLQRARRDDEEARAAGRATVH